MTHFYDVIIIGGGNAGFAVSSVVQEAGKSVAFIEARDFGGTCPNRGCTPKKVLVAAAHSLDEIARASAHGIHVDGAELDWSALIRREQAMVSFIPDAMKGVAEKRGDVYEGTARFVGRNAVEVNGERLEAGHIVIATGSKPRPLPIPGAEHLVTSDELLSDPTRPERVVFIGGGVIALEFGHVFLRAGSEVTILEAMPRLLPRLEADAVAVLREDTERLGATVHTEVTVDAIEAVDGEFAVSYRLGDRTHVVRADRVVNGAGRVANVDTLDLDAAGIVHDGVRIDVDEHLRARSNPHVWVAGDALVYSAQLSPLATYEGRIVGENIVAGPAESPDYRVIPSAVYTIPALATVGLTEADARAGGLRVRVSTNDMREWFSGKSYAEPVAWAKVLIDEDTDQLLGAHLVGHRGEELIHTFSLAMQHGITATALKNSMFAFPTFSSDIKNLL